jgi:hypothetical protein
MECIMTATVCCAAALLCRECVVDTLEGPGIVRSQCPICKQPAWKKELKTNYKYLALADTTAQLTALLQQQGAWAAGSIQRELCSHPT